MKHLLIFATLLLCCLATLCAIGVGTNAQNGKSAMEYLEEGSAYYLKHDFKKAIPPYQRAFDLEKEHATLDKTLWKVLVDNLGMSYGITGNLKKAKEIFEYGISKVPDYPMFYYNMACTYGEMKDMDKAIEYLRLAFARRENMIEGEHIPDPASDSSFERFMKEQRFLDALKEINN